MTERFLLHHLAAVERHITEGERHLLRQREIVGELEGYGRGRTETAKIARELLESFEMAQSAHLNDRVRLLHELAERT
jgi:hypothetical protein